LNEILEKIAASEHIVVISHIDPDADSLGSASAMYTFLLQNHKKVTWFCKTKNIDRKFSCIPWFENIKESFPLSADLAIAFDCADKKRLGTEIGCELINIDHHATNSLYGDINLVHNAISTTEILHNFFKANGFKINKKTATALYAGLLEDSEAFLSTKVDGTTFASALELIESGADFKLCNKKILKSTSLGTLRIKAFMFANMSLECNAKIAFFCVSDEEIKASGADYEDCKNPLEESLNLEYVEAALLLIQNSDFTVKGSIRTNGNINAGEIAKKIGGGGHLSRAGFELECGVSLEDAKSMVLNLIKKDL
jgi:phosphoesterase RecJ-like protein